MKPRISLLRHTHRLQVHTILRGSKPAINFLRQKHHLISRVSSPLQSTPLFWRQTRSWYGEAVQRERLEEIEGRLKKRGIESPENFTNILLENLDYIVRFSVIFNSFYWWTDENIFHTQETIDLLWEAMFQKKEIVNEKAVEHIEQALLKEQLDPSVRTQQSYIDFFQETCAEAINLDPSPSLGLR
ncbi:MAG: hypothetical protein V3V61_07130 [Gammaproteobacteria bacterium]